MTVMSTSSFETDAQIDAMSGDERRRLLAALIRAYARVSTDEPPVAADQVTTEDAVVMAAALLRVKDVTSFELAALFDV